MVKLWLSSHQELSSPPKFRVEVVGSYQDAMTRQIAKAVRIESMCSIVKLSIVDARSQDL